MGASPATTGEGYASELGTGSPCRWPRRSTRDITVLLHGNESDCVYHYGTTPAVEAAILYKVVTGQMGVPGRLSGNLYRLQRVSRDRTLAQYCVLCMDILRTSRSNAGFPVMLGRHALQGLCTAFSGRNFSVEFGGGRGPGRGFSSLLSALCFVFSK
jgi:hypothetical protein